MLKKLRTFLVALLLTPLLALNAHAFTEDADALELNPVQQSNVCWVYMGGRWWLLPC